MHYANGRAARAGDVVRGKGYNIKHEIVGLLVFANPAADSCNCQVATVTKGSPVLHYAYPNPEPNADGAVFFKATNPPSFKAVEATLEYGPTGCFCGHRSEHRGRAARRELIRRCWWRLPNMEANTLRYRLDKALKMLHSAKPSDLDKMTELWAIMSDIQLWMEDVENGRFRNV